MQQIHTISDCLKHKHLHALRAYMHDCMQFVVCILSIIVRKAGLKLNCHCNWLSIQAQDIQDVIAIIMTTMNKERKEKKITPLGVITGASRPRGSLRLLY